MCMHRCTCMFNNDRDLLEHPRVILVSPYEDLGDRPKCLNNSLLVVVSDGRISEQHLVLVPTQTDQSYSLYSTPSHVQYTYSTASY